ncbi:MAG: 1-acyl-sn-glycerol-3-phosphate acyltransferase, partial [uncultured Solirubrobacteraceae bacterium]
DAHLPRRAGDQRPDRAPVGPAAGRGRRAPAAEGALAGRRQPRLLLGPGRDRDRRDQAPPDPRACEVLAVEGQGPRQGARRDGPDPDPARQRRRGRTGPRDRGAARGQLHRDLSRGHPQPGPRAAPAQRLRPARRSRARGGDRAGRGDRLRRHPALPQAPAPACPVPGARRGPAAGRIAGRSHQAHRRRAARDRADHSRRAAPAGEHRCNCRRRGL